MLSSFDFDLVIHVTLFIISIVLLFIYFCYLFTLLLWWFYCFYFYCWKRLSTVETYILFV